MISFIEVLSASYCIFSLSSPFLVPFLLYLSPRATHAMPTTIFTESFRSLSFLSRLLPKLHISVTILSILYKKELPSPNIIRLSFGARDNIFRNLLLQHTSSCGNSALPHSTPFQRCRNMAHQARSEWKPRSSLMKSGFVAVLDVSIMRPTYGLPGGTTVAA